MPKHDPSTFDKNLATALHEVERLSLTLEPMGPPVKQEPVPLMQFGVTVRTMKMKSVPTVKLEDGRIIYTPRKAERPE